MVQAKRILVVDDEAPNRDLLEALLESLGIETELACDGIEALAKIKLGFDLVLLDVMMPGMDGFEVARRIRQDVEFGDVPIVMATALTGKEDRLRAVEAGANDFITKPIDKIELRVRTASLLKMKEAQDVIKRHQKELEETVQKRTEALRLALADMAAAQRRTQEAHLDTLQRLVLAAEYKDEDTAIHLQRMSRYAALLAKKLNLPPGEVELIRLASPMHDVGKIGIPELILLKPGQFTSDEFEKMKQHTHIGGRILNGSPSELLKAGEIIALTHHEKWDGTGYPNGLVGEAIPLWGRISTVADVFDALTSQRPYKKAFTNDQAVTFLRDGRAKHFDPTLLDLFLDHFDEVVAIQQECRKP
ncbi:MAG: response regulator [Nitrospirae bacterium]|nr:response regulator [Nitrospirota bacterium]